MKEYTIEEAIKSPQKYFYFNIFGWKTYFTLEPTLATPTGKLWYEGFPRIIRTYQGKIKPTKKLTLN